MLELGVDLLIAAGLLTLGAWLERRFREVTRKLRGLEALAIEHDAGLFRLHEALQQQREQGQQHADRSDERGPEPFPVRAVKDDQGVR